MKKKTLIIILAILIPLLLFAYRVYASFNGSLFRKIIMTSQADRYVSENFSDMDLTVDFAAYDFKMNGYYCNVHTETDSDLRFIVYTDNNGDLTDDFEYRVLNKENTIARLSRALDDYTDDFLKDHFPHRTSLVLCDIDWDAMDGLRDNLTLDMPFDIETFPLPCTMTGWVETADGVPGWKELEERLRELYALTKDTFPFVTHYSISIQEPYSDFDGEWGPEDPSADVCVFDVPVELIAGDGLNAWLEYQRVLQDMEQKEIEKGNTPADKTE